MIAPFLKAMPHTDVAKELYDFFHQLTCLFLRGKIPYREWLQI